MANSKALLRLEYHARLLLWAAGILVLASYLIPLVRIHVSIP